MTPDTDEHVFHGELLTPDFITWMTVCDLHQTFEHLAKVYGLSRAQEIWDEIPKEHSDEPR